MRSFAFLTDLHWGYEAGKKPIHNLPALRATLKFLGDLKPDVVILGGDMLDCGALSHWNEKRRRDMEGLRILADAKELGRVLEDIQELAKETVYIMGNHEAWLDQFEDKNPGLDGLLKIPYLLPNFSGKIIPQGGHYKLGKLLFLHGDQLKGGVHVAKQAVEVYGHNIRFGHFHTAQMFTRMSPIDQTDIQTGIAVPGLCHRGPNYSKGAPNRWATGFLWGYVQPNGRFTDYLTMIVNNRFTALGKTYEP